MNKTLAVGMILCCMLYGEEPGRQEASRAMPSTKVTVSDQAILERKLARWQKDFQLQDWRINIRIVRAWELNMETVGHIRWEAEKKTASIEVLDPRDYDLPAERIPSDLELTVIHELTHLALSPLRSGERSFNKNQRSLEESVVNLLSRLLAEQANHINYLTDQNARLAELIARKP